MPPPATQKLPDRTLVAERARDRVGLAGQHRLVELQRARLEQAAVGDHLLARLEPDRVALDDVVDRHRDRLAVAQHAGARGDEQRQAVELRAWRAAPAGSRSPS